ncbi:ATP-binding protein [Actinoplanes oblitus]|uniref:ATP-binding protein n=1 Tax=Actinoplanes oblitus TaxID=3040509 RepID=A0ABY8WPQ8_9ACTN|nr:ATP-binding protein [Actinoplanes oblitus]WIM99866.1 ATP-binding protein [Actinoplanes oblitus]
MSTLTAHFDLPLDSTAPGWARSAVTAVLGGWGLRDRAWLDDVAAVVSELVTNAVRHGGGAVVVDVEAYGGQVIVSVADGSSVVPRPRRPDGTGGLGLRIIDALTARWFVESYEGGKRVRAEMPLFPGRGVSATGTSRVEPA